MNRGRHTSTRGAAACPPGRTSKALPGPDGDWGRREGRGAETRLKAIVPRTFPRRGDAWKLGGAKRAPIENENAPMNLGTIMAAGGRGTPKRWTFDRRLNPHENYRPGESPPPKQRWRRGATPAARGDLPTRPASGASQGQTAVETGPKVRKEWEGTQENTTDRLKEMKRTRQIGEC